MTKINTNFGGLLPYFDADSSGGGGGGSSLTDKFIISSRGLKSNN